MKIYTPLKQAGDTIVEVIVVLAVLGMAVSISYATANRSLLATRQAEENTQATALLQAQLEALRSYSANTDNTSSTYIYQTSGGYCLDASGNVVTSATLTPASTGNYTVYPHYTTTNECMKNSLFHIAIFYDSASGDTFTARATWDDVTGKGQDTVTLAERLHSN